MIKLLTACDKPERERERGTAGTVTTENRQTDRQSVRLTDRLPA